MTEEELLQKVKDLMNIGENTHLDESLKIFIQACNVYIQKAGVSEKTLASEEVIPTIAIGVNNLFKDGVFSEFFYQSVIQLAVTKDE